MVEPGTTSAPNSLYFNLGNVWLDNPLILLSVSIFVEGSSPIPNFFTEWPQIAESSSMC
jgi:hypothetical protein